MKKILKLFDESKTLQIILDKCIIGIFILLAAFLININLENAKTKNNVAAGVKLPKNVGEKFPLLGI